MSCLCDRRACRLQLTSYRNKSLTWRIVKITASVFVWFESLQGSLMLVSVSIAWQNESQHKERMLVLGNFDVNYNVRNYNLYYWNTIFKNFSGVVSTLYTYMYCECALCMFLLMTIHTATAVLSITLCCTAITSKCIHLCWILWAPQCTSALVWITILSMWFRL